MESELVKLTRGLKRLQKAFKKTQPDSAPVEGAKAKRGFTKPVLVSESLASFLGLDSTQPISRADVTLQITKYVMEHSLKDPKDGRVIVPDAALASVLKDPSSDAPLANVTWFTLQRYLKHHYRKVE
jgi:chromatin remodeling complex protein RSC6